MPGTLVRLGRGAYNTAYYDSENPGVIYKRRRKGKGSIGWKLDSPERSVRLWNEINPTLRPLAEIRAIEVHTPVGSQTEMMWASPYILGRQASDRDICLALIDIYSRTGRIVFDAVSTGNFLTTSEGTVVLVDVGLALLLDSEEALSTSERKRRHSIVSLEGWAVLEEGIQRYLHRESRHHVDVATVIWALVYIKQVRPDITDVSRLKDNDKLIRRFSKHDYSAFSELEPPCDTSSTTLLTPPKRDTVLLGSTLVDSKTGEEELPAHETLSSSSGAASGGGGCLASSGDPSKMQAPSRTEEASALQKAGFFSSLPQLSADEKERVKSAALP